jgi:hypothetical protein
MAPEEPNGRISHYIVQASYNPFLIPLYPPPPYSSAQIEPQPSSSTDELAAHGEEEAAAEWLRPWTDRVPHPQAGGDGTADLGPDGSETLLPREPIQVEKVLDGLFGGRQYRMEVWPVNEAGQGRGGVQKSVEMPIAGWWFC